MVLKSLFKKSKPMPLPSSKNFTNDPNQILDSTDFSVEAAKQAMSSNRLFFDKTSKELVAEVPIEGSVAVKVESKDLYKDFFDSMKEMVEISDKNGEVKDLEWLEEMLEWYLKMNKRCTHESIISAYLDLVLEVYESSSTCSCVSTRSSFVSSSSTTSVSTSLSSSSYVSCLSDIEEVEEVDQIT